MDHSVFLIYNLVVNIANANVNVLYYAKLYFYIHMYPFFFGNNFNNGLSKVTTYSYILYYIRHSKNLSEKMYTPYLLKHASVYKEWHV